MLPLTLRQRFLFQGLAVVPRELIFKQDAAAIATEMDALHRSLLTAVRQRSSDFLSVPSVDNVLKTSSMLRDPFYERLHQRMELYQRNRRQRRARLRKHRATVRQKDGNDQLESALEGGDILDLSRAVAQAMLQREHRNQASECASTVDTDEQLRAAIHKHRCNLWMTCRELSAFLQGDVGRALGQAASEIGGVESPVLFGDSPAVSDSFGRPVAMHCSAPFIGVDICRDDAVTAFLFLHDPSPTAMPVFAIEGVQREVSEQLLQRRGALMEKLHTDFVPMHSHMMFTIGKLKLPAEAVALPVAPLRAGDVLLCSPTTLVSLGPNFRSHPIVVPRIHIVSMHARPSLSPPSWIRSWRSRASEVSFRAGTVFPPLHSPQSPQPQNA